MPLAQIIYDLYEAKLALWQLVERAAAGEEIVIAKNGAPMAKLVPVARPKRHPGGWEGRIRIADDFDDALLPEIQDAFEGRS
jgi:prevent-host-death family protein